MKRIFLAISVLLATFTLAACGNEDITVQVSDTFLELELGEQTTIDLVITPDNTNEAVVWISANTSVATVSSTGTISANALGSTNIRVHVGDIT